MTGYTIRLLKKVLAFSKANPDKKFTLPESVTGHWAACFNEFTGESWLRWFKKCLHKKINRNEPKRGRKEDSHWQNRMKASQRLLNNSRSVIHWRELHPDLRKRFFIDLL